MSNSINRRLFMKGSASALGYFFTAEAFSAARAADKPMEKLRIAGIGVTGKGDSDVSQAATMATLVALCDIDDKRLGEMAERRKYTAKKYFDFRKMFSEMEKEIDAVIVATPDNTHAVASTLAMHLKKHVYCQKPLTHDIYEARVMRELAKKNHLCTQMGNQGTASDGLRRGAEIIQGGLLGAVKEVHVWTNRPLTYWKQAPDVMARKPSEKVPAHIHWDEFLGPAPERPFASGYHPMVWRGWLDFGTGCLGDMGCHTSNLAFMGLKLGHPTSVIAEAGDVNDETYPSWSHITLQFPARGEMSPVTFHWYDGKKDGKKVIPPLELLAKVQPPGQKPTDLAGSGSIIVGDKAILFSPNDYGEDFTITPKPDYQIRKPEHLPSNNKGDEGHKAEWIKAIQEGKPELALSNFDYAGMLTEAILLGNVALRSCGEKLEWDGPNMVVTNNKKANQFVKREYRKGWELFTS